MKKPLNTKDTKKHKVLKLFPLETFVLFVLKNNQG